MVYGEQGTLKSFILSTMNQTYLKAIKIGTVRWLRHVKDARTGSTQKAYSA
jgi:hypothetical protein